MITGEIYQPDPENVPHWWEYRITKGDEEWDSYYETYNGLPSQRLTHDDALNCWRVSPTPHSMDSLRKISTDGWEM